MYRKQCWRGFKRHWLFTVFVALLMLAGIGCGKKKTRLPTPPPVVAPGEEVGVASWYGHPYHGRRTANGEVYDMEKLTAAHQTREFDTWVRVHNLDNGSTVDVRINDRGPFVDNRIIDLSKAAARTIGMIGPGTAWVRIEDIEAPPPESDSGSPPHDVPLYAVQAGAFAYIENAEGLSETLNEHYGNAYVQMGEDDPPVWRVFVGEFSTRSEAESFADTIREEFGAVFVVRLPTGKTP